MSITESLIKRRRIVLAAEEDEEDLSPAQAAKRWEHFTDPSVLLNKATRAYGLLGAIFAHKAFFDGAGKVRPPKADKQAAQDEQQAVAMRELHVEHKIGDSGDFVYVAIRFPDLRCYIGGAPATPTKEQAVARETGLEIIKAVFPSMDLDKLPVSSGHVVAAIPPRKMPIEALGSKNMPGLTPLTFEDWHKEYRGAATFILQPFDIATDGSSISTSISPHTSVHFSVGVTLKLKLPKAYALWSTDSDDSSFTLIAFWKQFSNRIMYYGKSEPEVDKPDPIINNPARVQQVTQSIINRYGFTPKPQVNAEGICVLPSGQLVWVPEASELNVSGAMNQCVKPLEAEEPPDSMRDIDTKALEDRHVGTSWLTNKMIVTDSNCVFHVIDLNGARPPSQAGLAHLMSQPIGEENMRAMIAITSRLQMPTSVNNSYGMDYESYNGIAWENLMDVPFDAVDEDTETQSRKLSEGVNKILFDLGKDFATAYERLVSSDIPVYEQFDVRPYFALFGVYAKNRLEWSKQLGAQLALNRAAVDPEHMPKLHDMPGVNAFMPHQVRVSSEIAMQPTGALLDVRAGGGKSLSLIEDVTGLMYAGKITRPCLAMPRNLLPQFAREIIRFTSGHLRPFILSNKTWKKLIYGGEVRHIKFRNKDLDIEIRSIIELIKKQPRNTVFLVDYNWMAQGMVEIGMMGESAPFYPHAAILDRLGVDYIAADESQRAKSLTANRSIATSIVFANAKYRRISSGTILHDTAKDVVGQMALIEPLAMGAVGDYVSKKKSARSRSVRADLITNIQSFARKIQVPRREWAHLLPRLIERVHPCKMTKVQQNFNDKIMERAMKKLADDPKLKRLEKMDPEKAQQKIESLLKRYFAALEIWINAPDSQAAHAYGLGFSEMENVTEADLRSSKMDTIDNLIDQHFNGGTVVINDNDVSVAPDPNKIIVVGYNKEVSKHIFRHSRFAHLGVHYAAGDDQALAAFESDAEGSPKILYADLGSITEGKNLQIASRMIVTQIVWTPGMQEQLTARIWRPDVPDKNGQVKYQREYVWVDFVVCIPSIEVPKQARLISKQVENLLVEEEDSSPSLRGLVESNPMVFQKVRRVALNLDFIKKNALEQQSTNGVPNILNDQFRAYRIVKGWERSEFDKALDDLRQKVFERTGKKPSNKELARMAMIKVTSDATPEFVPSKALQSVGYIPWADGFTGFNPTSLKLLPLSMELEEDEDDDEEKTKEEIEAEQTVRVEVGDPVVTQFGPGVVTKARSDSQIVFVSIPGYHPQPVPFWRYVVLGATNDVDKQALRNMLKQSGKDGLPLLKLDPKTHRVIPVNSKIPEEHIINAQKTAERMVNDNQKKGSKSEPIVRGRGGVRMQVTDEPKPTKRSRISFDVPDELQPTRPKAEPRGISRSPGVNDQFVKPGKVRGRPVEEPKVRTRQGKVAAPIDILHTNDDDLWDTRNADAILLNGAVCILTNDGSESDPILLQNGFDRIGRSVVIQIRNPKGYRALVSLLAKKFEIPTANKRALDDFGDYYEENRQRVAYMKASESMFHQKWLRDQHKAASDKNEIRPWPVVENGRPVLYINRETCPAANRLKTITMPQGVGNKSAVKAALIAMVRSTNDAKTLLRELKSKHVRFEDEALLLNQLRKIRG